MERLLTVDEVANLLQVKPRTIYLWVHENYIPTVKLGACVRFHPASIAQWIKKKEAQGRTRRRYDWNFDEQHTDRSKVGFASKAYLLK